MKLPSEFPVVIKTGTAVVKIYRQDHPDGDLFTVAYYDPTGARKRENFSDYKKADDRARAIGGSFARGEVESITLTRDECLTFKRANAAAQKFGLALDEAIKEWAELRATGLPLRKALDYYRERHQNETQTIPTVRELATEMITQKRDDGGSVEYCQDLETRLNVFARDFANIPVNELVTEKIDAWLRNRQKVEKNSGRSRNNYRRSILSLVHYAEKRKLLRIGDINPKHIEKAKESEMNVETFTPEEMTKLLKAAQYDVKHLPKTCNARFSDPKKYQGLLAMLVLTSFGAMRNKEVTRQKWSDINLKTGTIRVTGAKGGTAAKRLIPIRENLRAWLEHIPRVGEFCCPYASAPEALERLAERAQVEWKHNGLRHSYVSYRVAETQSVSQVALESGNSERMIRKHYLSLKTKEEAAEWFGIMPEPTTGRIVQFKVA